MGFSKKAIEFQGTTEHVLVGHVIPFRFDVGDAFSISCWFRTTTSGVVQSLVSKRSSGAPSIGYGVGLTTSGFLFLQVAEDVTFPRVARIEDATDVTDGEWHHVVATKGTTENASDLTLYLDGVDASASITDDNFVSNGGTTFDTSATLQFSGLDGTTTEAFLGHIDDVAIYDRELTLAEAQEIYASGSPVDNRLLTSAINLVGYWPMGDGDSHPTIHDRQVGQPTTTALGFLDRGSGDNDGSPVNTEDADFRDVVLATETVPDLSGNNNTGTPTNMEDADFTAESPGGSWSKYSANLDGTAEFIDCGDGASLQFERTDEFSISCWFRTNTASSDTFVAKMSDSPDFRGYALQFSGIGQIQVELRNAVGDRLVVNTDNTFRDDTWHHVVFTWNGTISTVAANVTIYVDGVNEAVTTSLDGLTATIANTAGLKIGARGDATPANFWTEYITDVAVYDKELSLAEVQAIYNSGIPLDNRSLSTASNLAGYWRCGDASPGGVSRFVTNLDGVDEYITMGDVLGLDSDDPRTISCWFRTTDATGNLVSKRDVTLGVESGYSLAYVSGQIQFSVSRFSGLPDILTIRTNSTFNDGSWHHVLVTYDGSLAASGADIWVDGVSQTLTVQQDTLTGPSLTSASFNLGGRNDGSGPELDGQMTEAAVWDRVLTNAEIAEVYNSGSPPDLTLLLSSSPNLIGYWAAGELANDATMTNMAASNITGTLFGSAAVAGSADTIVTPGVFKLINSAVLGQGTLAADALFLVYSDVSGQAAINGQSQLVVAGVSSLSGQATTASDPDMLFAASAAAVADAEALSAAIMSYAGQAAIAGDAVLTAAALADDEIAADARASASSASAAFVNYGAEATVQGDSSTLAVGLLRPALLPSTTLPPEQRSFRLVGLQAGRSYPERVDRNRVSTDGAYLRARRTNDEVAASIQRNRVRTSPTDAASRELRERVRSGFNPNES